MRNNTAFIDAMTEDWNRFLSVVQTDKEGNRLNIIKVDGVDSADEKVIGKRLQEIAKNATTGGLYTQVGELYGFPIKVVSERILKEGLEFTDNRFVVEGNYKYTYNNGHLAMADPLAAARNFLNAMERIPSIIDQYKAKNEVLEMEIPQLQEIAGKVWKKEDELKQLKSELAALDRKNYTLFVTSCCKITSVMRKLIITFSQKIKTRWKETILLRKKQCADRAEYLNIGVA